MMAQPDRCNFLVNELKDILRLHGLSTVGNKSELIQRLDEKFPNRAWVEEPTKRSVGSENMAAAETTQSVAGGTPQTNELRRDAQIGQNTCEESPPDSLLRMEVDLLRRERDLMRRELQLAQRENEMLRSSPASSRSSENRSSLSVKVIGDLLSDFDGRNQIFRNWERQLKLLISTYGLDQNFSRILIVSKLKGEALQWFHSRSENLEINVDELLGSMETMFSRRESSLEARRKLEARRWAVGEHFGQYCHDKITLANNVSISEEETIEYVIDGIPNINLRNQACLANFKSTAELLAAFSRVSLGSEERNQRGFDTFAVRSKTRMPVEGKPSPPTVNVRCYNCNRMGHRSSECRLPRREKGSCFGCGETGHLLPACPKKREPRVNFVENSTPREDEFHRNLNFVMDNIEEL
ncbi:uncharacterized protein LOC144472765 [Augochlora pura]